MRLKPVETSAQTRVQRIVPQIIPKSTGGQILIDTLADEGIRHVFTVPGESFLAALDAMHADPRVQPITTRNEAGAAMMAEATGKLTGRPGVALVTRGPGAANALAGVYIAHQDQTPMLLLVGLPPSKMNGLPAFQTIDLKSVFGSLSKSCDVVTSVSELPEKLRDAFLAATTSRPGPVVLGLPEDILSQEIEFAPPTKKVQTPCQPLREHLDQLKTYLAYAERPFVIAGSTTWSAGASAALARFAERFDIPVATSFRRQDAFDNRHRCYVGHLGLSVDPQLATGIRASDLIIVFGQCLGDISTQGFTLLKPENTTQRIVLIAADAGSPECPFVPALAITACPIETANALSEMATPGKRPPWPIWRRDLRHAYEATLKLNTPAAPSELRLDEVIADLSRELPDDAIISNGAGNYAAFLHRYFVYKSYPSQLAPVAGSMGYGVPAAIAAKLRHPDRVVVALAGDGCFQLTGLELATAVQFGLPIIIIIANNGILGTIRMHQENRYPGRVTATTLVNPDFVALAEAMGALGFRVTARGEFQAAIAQALTAIKPAVIELKLDAEAIAPGQSLSSLRDAIAKTNNV